MSTVRRGPLPTDNYTIVSNGWTRDAALSWEARGLLAWLAGHSETHQITEADMIAAGSFKRDGVRRMIRELEARGYLIRERTYDVRGGSTVDYVLVDARPTASPADGRGGGRSEQGELFPEQKESAPQPTDLPADGLGGGRSYTEDQKKIKTPSVSRPQRATRISDDYIPDEKMRAWFAAESLHHVIDVRAEHAKFVDHFLAAPGERGRKLDWPATWRNWMRRAAERAQRGGYRPPGSALSPVSGAPMHYSQTSKTNQRVAEGLALAKKFAQMEESQ